jgi:hypothetical protein
LKLSGKNFCIFDTPNYDIKNRYEHLPLFLPYNPRAQGGKPVNQMFVAAFNLINIAYNAFSVGAEGGDKHCHAGADIGADKFGTVEFCRAGNYRPVGIA